MMMMRDDDDDEDGRERIRTSVGRANGFTARLL
jgi:hypothetical protein